MASNDEELSNIPDFSKEDSTSETSTHKAHNSRDKVVRHNKSMIIDRH